MNDLDALRDRLVLASVNHAPFDGWSKAALDAAAKDCGLDPSEVDHVFPAGAIDAVEHWTALADRRLEADASLADLAEKRVSERMNWLVRQRIEAWTDQREAVRRAVSLLALPRHSARALRLTWRTADALWHAANDTSTDFSYYTKRLTLAGVYSTTLLVWLEDKSEDFADTWAFLDRRVNDAGEIGKLRRKLQPNLAIFRDPFGLHRRTERRRRTG